MSNNAVSLELTSLTSNKNSMQPTEDTHLTTAYRLQESPRSMEPIPQDDQSDDYSNSTTSSEEELEMSLTELLYSSSSFHAIVKPVTLTMTLAAMAVIFINNEQTIEQGEKQLAAAYTVWTPTDADGTAKTLGISLANGLVMVSVICLMTFGIVLLYKFRCMKFLIGYMIFSSATLLGLLGGQLFDTAIEIYRIPIDTFSFFFAVYNFCIVGVLAIFWSKGIPSYLTQGYLVATSVILAWQLAHFDEWTTWTLLFMLAIYDLCAVLTPCGPLKALVNLMSEDDSPDMPGLLYEAELPPEARRPGNSSSGSNSRSNSRPESASSSRHEARNTSASVPAVSAASSAETERSGPPGVSASGSMSVAASSVATSAASSTATQEDVTAVVPLAVARVYKLPVISYTSSDTVSRQRRGDREKTGVSTSPLLDDDSTAPVSAGIFRMPEHPTPAELKRDVTVRLPRNGGRLERIGTGRKRVYLERDKHGNPNRTLWVDREGKVFAEAMEDDDESEGGENGKNSIRLGLGDFIFYSVLVATAAKYSFTTFAACMLVILAGLGGTLVLLSVYHQALPALPISIFLAIVFYLMTRIVIEPWIEGVLNMPYYV